MMFWRTLIFANGWVIWKVRTMPAAQILCGASPVMSRPSKATRPASGAWKPAMAANSVVLPAPLGPISPTISPWRTSSEAWSTAFSPPNDLERPRTSSMARLSPEQAHQAVRQSGHDQHQHDAIDHQAERLHVLQRRHDAGEPARHLVDAGQGKRADQRTEDGAGAAHHADQQHLDRLVDAEGDGGIDVEIFLGIERAARRAHRARQDEHLHLLGEDVDAERPGSVLVLPNGDQTSAEAASRQPPGDQDRNDAEQERDVIDPDRVPELEIDRPRIGLDQHAETSSREGHGVGKDAEDLGKGQRDQREVGAAQACTE